MLRIGHPEWRDRIFTLTIDAKGTPAGDQRRDLRSAGEQLGDLGCGVDHLLEVVQHQEQALAADPLAEAVERLSSRVDEPHRLGDRGQN